MFTSYVVQPLSAQVFGIARIFVYNPYTTFSINRSVISEQIGQVLLESGCMEGRSPIYQSKRIRYTFNLNDGNGYLERSKIKSVVSNKGIFASDKITDSVFSDFDINDNKKTFLFKISNLFWPSLRKCKSLLVIAKNPPP